MDTFSNQTIDFSSLPKYKEAQLTPIASRYKKIVIFNLIISTIIIMAIEIALLLFVFETLSWLYKGLILSFTFILLIIYNIISLIAFKRKSFAFREQDLIYKSGILSISYEIVPYNRLQHVVLKQGWFSRYLGLATIECFTAASADNEIAIPGLELEKAEQIKNMLLNKIIHTDLNDEILNQENTSTTEIDSEIKNNESKTEENATN